MGSPQHILAHLLLGAAVSYATGNDVVTGGLGASAGEATAPLLSKLIYQKPTSELTAEQKDTISSIASLTGVAIGATTGNVTDAVNAGETALVAVQENDGRMINGKWCDPGECDSKGNPINRITFSDNEALAIKAVIGTVVWPAGVLEAYLAADNDAEKLAILKTAFSPLKSRALLEVLENTQVAKSRANKPSNQTANRAGKTCSFRGDMLVKTISGYRPISEVRIGNMVLSKNEITGKLTYQSVSNHYNNSYNATVYITIKDSNGNTQTIVSNKIHPFFTQVNTGAQLPQSSEGHNYQGNIDNAQWIDASNLKAGYQLLSEDGQWQVVQSVRQTEESLSAYNLTVDNDHTYFVTGSDSTYGVWVHNDCWTSLPDGAEASGKTLPNGSKLYQYKEDGKIKLLYKGKDGRYYDKDVYKPDDLKAQQGAKENKPPEHISNIINPPNIKSMVGINGIYKVKGKTSVQGGGKLRERWKDKKGRIYEWDYQHGELEKYNSLGNHMGVFDPKTGLQIKPAIKNRKITP